MVGRDPDPEPVIDTKRLGYLLLDEGGVGSALGIGAPHHLGDGPAEGEGHVAGQRAGLHHRYHVGQSAAHPVEVDELLYGHTFGHEGDSQAMAQSVPKGGPVLAVGAELGPVMGHGGVIVNQALFRLDVQGHRGHGLGHGECGEYRVLVNRPPCGLVGKPGPHVHGELAVKVGRYLEPYLAAVAYGTFEGFPDDLVRIFYACLKLYHQGASSSTIFVGCESMVAGPEARIKGGTDGTWEKGRPSRSSG